MAKKMIRALSEWALSHRHFYVFASLILLIALLPVFDVGRLGRWAFLFANILILASLAVAFGRSRFSFWVAILVSGIAIVLMVEAHRTDSSAYLLWAWILAVGIFLPTVGHLFRALLRRGRVGVDELYGGVAGYMLLGLLWCYLYALVEYFSPGSFFGLGPHRSLHVADAMYFSFNVLTTVGFTDITPQGKGAHSLVILQELAGTLVLVVVIARLVGQYQQPGPRPDDPVAPRGDAEGKVTHGIGR
jgi:hypothetical protein